MKSRLVILILLRSFVASTRIGSTLSFSGVVMNSRVERYGWEVIRVWGMGSITPVAFSLVATLTTNV